jgi:molybdenum cofactor cytidylyltransferase
MTNIPHVLLAAGNSTRMGQPKQLLRWSNNSLIQFQVETILPTTEKLYVILGAYAELIQPLLKNYEVELIQFDQWEKGMGNSLAYGIQQILYSNPKIEGILISLIDQPLVATSHYLNMRATFKKRNNQIIASESGFGWSGVPALFDSYYFDELQKLSGEEGAKLILKKNEADSILINAGNTLIDMDTPEVYRKLLKKFSPQS